MQLSGFAKPWPITASPHNRDMLRVCLLTIAPPQALYCLLKGDVLVHSKTRGLSITLPAGTCFGESALVTQMPRQATVQALANCLVMIVRNSGQLPSALLARIPDVTHTVISQLLSKVPFFGNMPQKQMDLVAGMLHLEQFGMEVPMSPC